MKALPSSGGRSDLERPVHAGRNNELFVAFIGMDTTGEHHSKGSVSGVSSEKPE